MDQRTPPLIGTAADHTRQYTDAENQRLAQNLAQITSYVHRGDLRSTGVAVELLCHLHRALFHDVRSHAGQIRGPDFGSDILTFGPNRSVNRPDVPDQLLDTFSEVRKSLASFEANPSDPDFDMQAIRLAVWAHAEVIRIHPFEDGNGRSSRLLLNCILVRLGLRPVAMEGTRHEYVACLNHYFRSRDLTPLLDLWVGAYVDQHGL